MKTVCAALIVKNESKVIERCLNSIKDFENKINEKKDVILDSLFNKILRD